MLTFIAKRVRFENGERCSVLSRPGGLPVHEATLYLASYRRRGRAANTIHGVCRVLALLYRELAKAGIDLLYRLRKGEFLTIPELNRLADAAQYRLDDLSDEDVGARRGSNVIDIKRIQFRMRRKVTVGQESIAVGVISQASRLRYMRDYLEFLATYIGATLPPTLRSQLMQETSKALKAFRAEVPRIPKRARLGDREGLSKEDQDWLLKAIHPDSTENPWKRGFVRQRNWLIVVLLLATGMRRGELLGLQIRDLDQRFPRLRILRRADASEDPRDIQPCTKTGDREIELRPAIMRVVWNYINHQRRKIRAARKYPQLFVADDGQPLSLKSIDKIFRQIREAYPGLPDTLTSHVLRHTWNDRFSDQAEIMGLTDAVEEKARNEQQGWADNSKSSATYTRRHASRRGRELSLSLQEQLDVPDH
jgi:integrase